MSTPQDAVRYVLTRDVDAQRIHFSATFPERKDAWTLQLPTWRPGRYELGNFAQYVLWVEGIDQEGVARGCQSKICMHVPSRGIGMWNGCSTPTF